MQQTFDGGGEWRGRIGDRWQHCGGGRGSDGSPIMIPVRLQAPMKVQIPQLEFFALYDRALRRGGLEIRRWRQHAAARNLWARLLQTSCVPVTPSPLDPRDRHTGHSLQHLVSLLHLQDHRSLFPRLHRPNFPRHFRRGKRKYHCVARATTLKTVVPFKKKTRFRLSPQIFPFLSSQCNVTLCLR